MKTASSPPFRSIPVNPTLRLFAYQCRRLYFRTMYRMIPSSRSTFGVIPISAMRIQNMVCILPPFTWRIPKVLYMHTMNLLHIYIRMAYVKFLKEIKIFFIKSINYNSWKVRSVFYMILSCFACMRKG